jgi:hypothetical protein
MKWLLIIVVVVVYILHQDFWLWHDKTLVLGILPIGLAYHAGFAILAACMMALLVKYAWPTHLEQSVPDTQETSEAAHP